MTIHESSLPKIVQITQQISFHERQITSIEAMDIQHTVVLSPASGENAPVSAWLHEQIERSQSYINDLFKKAFIADQRHVIEGLYQQLEDMGVKRDVPAPMTFVPVRRTATKVAPRKQRRAA